MLEAFATKISLFSKMFITVTATLSSRIETTETFCGYLRRQNHLSAQNKLIKESILSIHDAREERTDFVPDDLAPVCHVAEIGEQHLLVLRQRSRLLRRSQHRLLRRELFVKVGHVLRAALQKEEDTYCTDDCSSKHRI